ncbi:MAG: acyl--CoA ligase [Bacilli bacterium]|nr:acyl--CoA ligase [Bacilli bacterium]
MIDVNKTAYEAWLPVCEEYSKNEALFYEGKSISYLSFKKMINRIAYAYRELGLKEGDTIDILAPNLPEALASFFAASQCGLKVSLLHPLSKPAAVLEDYKNKGAKLLVSASLLLANMPSILNEDIQILSLPIKGSLPLFKKVLYPLINRKDRLDYKGHPNLHSLNEYKKEDTKSVTYDSKMGRVFLGSGGTSGKEKSIILSDYAFLSLIYSVPELIDKIDRNFTNIEMFSALPLFHGFGMAIGLMAFLYFGGSDFLVLKFRSKKAVQMVKRNKEAVFVGVPAMFQAMVNNKDFRGEKLKRIRASFVGGDFIPPALFDSFEGRIAEFGGKSYLHEGYGLTETVTVNAVNTDVARKKGSIGKAISCADHLIIDDDGKVLPPNTVGEIVVTGPTLMNGYLEGEDPFIEIDGKRYVKTGDLGKKDEDGFLYFICRKKRTIKKKGFNIYPLLVEKEISNLKGIVECAYLSRFGEKEEETYLFVHIDESIPSVEAKEEIALCIKKHFYEYVLPDHYVFTEAFPRTKVGKMDTKALWEYIK